jgi:hypothetical protein
VFGGVSEKKAVTGTFAVAGLGETVSLEPQAGEDGDGGDGDGEDGDGGDGDGGDGDAMIVTEAWAGEGK